MTNKEFIECLKTKLQYYFDIHENYQICNKTISLFAKSLIRNEKYLGSKKIVIWSYENNEYCLAKSTQKEINKKEILNFIQFLKYSINKLVTPNQNHMSSIINGIYISSHGFDEDSIKTAQKFKYSKTFCLGLKGWCDLRLILINLNKNQIYTNKKGKEVKKFYQNILKNNLLKGEKL